MSDSVHSLVFSGHMIDVPGRPVPRFPPQLEAAARRWIRGCILQAGSTRTIGYASGARGGDVLFHEECRALGLRTVMVLPFPARIFEKTSVSGVPGGGWVERFRKLWRETPKGDRIVLHLPQTGDPYSACNTRLVELATARGSFHLIALWDGKGGDGPGGTADLVAKARAGADVPDIAAPLDLAP